MTVKFSNDFRWGLFGGGREDEGCSSLDMTQGGISRHDFPVQMNESMVAFSSRSSSCGSVWSMKLLILRNVSLSARSSSLW